MAPPCPPPHARSHHSHTPPLSCSPLTHIPCVCTVRQSWRSSSRTRTTRCGNAGWRTSPFVDSWSVTRLCAAWTVHAPATARRRPRGLCRPACLPAHLPTLVSPRLGLGLGLGSGLGLGLGLGLVSRAAACWYTTPSEAPSSSEGAKVPPTRPLATQSEVVKSLAHSKPTPGHGSSALPPAPPRLPLRTGSSVCAATLP